MAGATACVEVVAVALEVLVVPVLVVAVFVAEVDAGVEVELAGVVVDGVELAGSGRVTITIFFDTPQPARTAAHATVTPAARNTAAA